MVAVEVNKDGTGGVLTAVGVPAGVASVVGEIVVSCMNLAATIDFNVVAPVVIGPPPPPPPKPATSLRVTEVDSNGVPVPDTDNTLVATYPTLGDFAGAVAVYDGGQEVDLDGAPFKPGKAAALAYFTQADGTITTTAPTAPTTTGDSTTPPA